MAGADAFRPLWVLPCYRHEAQLRTFLPQITETGIPVLAVDDGNDPPIAPLAGAGLLRLERNGGKGAALIAGAQAAAAKGYTHLVQIDADGQHALADALALIEAARREPETLFAGFPAYDASVPTARLKGREVTRLFLRLETGFRGLDGLCGCRVYPLRQLLELAGEVRSRRMGFDVEVVVKWLWKGYTLKQLPVRVTYPQDGISNFRMVRDNVGFFVLHARLITHRIFRLMRIFR